MEVPKKGPTVAVYYPRQLRALLSSGIILCTLKLAIICPFPLLTVRCPAVLGIPSWSTAPFCLSLFLHLSSNSHRTNSSSTIFQRSHVKFLRHILYIKILIHIMSDTMADVKRGMQDMEVQDVSAVGDLPAMRELFCIITNEKGQPTTTGPGSTAFLNFDAALRHESAKQLAKELEVGSPAGVFLYMTRAHNDWSRTLAFALGYR